MVRCGDDLLVRSYRGADGGWYRHARQYPHGRIKVRGTEHDVSFAEAAAISTDVVDRAYRDKYGAGGYVDAMIRDGAASTTLTLTPES